MNPASAQLESPPVAGILAEFDDPGTLVEAATNIRITGYSRWEAYSPFPVHGLDTAMGRRKTRLPWLVLLAGLTGGCVAMALQWWTNAVDYPFLISGKPYFSLPANIPVAFELIILFSAVTAFGGALALSGLPQFRHPLDRSQPFQRATVDRFFIAIDASDPQFKESITISLLQSLGAVRIEPYHVSDTDCSLPKYFIPTLAVLVALALMPLAWIAKVRYAPSERPRIHLVQDMDFQPKYLPQQTSPLFADGRGMRPPVPGTIPVDGPANDPHRYLGTVAGEPARSFPVPLTAALAARGRERYNVYCATCHGLAGDGDGITSQLAFEREEPRWIRPLSLHLESVRNQPVGQLFQTITDGIRTMPAYRSQIPVPDRWAIVLYMRALQRSRNATIDDVPDSFRSHLR